MPSVQKIGMKLEGLEDLKSALKTLEKAAAKKVIRKGINEASKIILKAAKSSVWKGKTRMLWKSLGRRVKTYRSSGKVVAIIGPRKGYTIKKVKLEGGGVSRQRVQSKLGKQFQALGVDPVKYAHFVEFGRKDDRVKKRQVMSDGTVIYGKKVADIPARPFLRPAIDNNKAAVESTLKSVIWAEIEKIAGKKSVGDEGPSDATYSN